MTIRHGKWRILLPAVYLALPAAAPVCSQELRVDEALAAPHREAKNTARDRYRHPAETLQFFGLRPDMQVLEISPGGGWYTEILAPLLRENGQLTVSSFGADHPVEYLAKLHRTLVSKMQANPEVYDRVRVVVARRPFFLGRIEDASMDMVLTFRNTHNWIRDGYAETMYREFFRVLRPGGTLGVVQHRAKTGVDPAASAERGYVPEDHVVRLAEQAGFRLSDRSGINANPLDTKDHPEGVWTLPPTYRLKERDRDKYEAIGESDRMTLKFTKPAT